MHHSSPETERQTRRLGVVETTTPRDPGLSLLELLVIVTILGMLATIVVVAASGMHTEAAETGCRADERLVYMGVESYFVNERVDTIPATGTGHDRFERTLVGAGNLRRVSEYHDVDVDGVITSEGTLPC